MTLLNRPLVKSSSMVIGIDDYAGAWQEGRALCADDEHWREVVMFQSFEHLGYDIKTAKYRWRYKIVDTEFEEVGVVVAGVGPAVEAGEAVIDTYSNRGLPVVPNLIRALQWYSSKYSISIEQVIAWQLQYNPKFKQYEQEIEKYLALL